MTNNGKEPTTATLAETDNYMIWKADEPDGETTYHIELNSITMHFFEEVHSNAIEFNVVSGLAIRLISFPDHVIVGFS